MDQSAGKCGEAFTVSTTQADQATSMVLVFLMMLLVVLIVLLVVSAIVMGTFNSVVGYLSEAFKFEFSKPMGLAPAIALVVLLWIVGALLFKKMETTSAKLYSDNKRDENMMTKALKSYGY